MTALLSAGWVSLILIFQSPMGISSLETDKYSDVDECNRAGRFAAEHLVSTQAVNPPIFMTWTCLPEYNDDILDSK